VSEPERPTMARARLLILLAIGALVLAACPTEDPVIEPGDDPPAEEPAEDADEPDDAPDEPAEDPDAAVGTGETDLGVILVDADGMTLYMFDQDPPGESACYDGCAATWPPLIDDGPVAGDGVDASLLGTTERDDGAIQVTYNDMPLYYFANDSEPGDVNGQGLNDVWWVVDPDGHPINDDGDAGGSPY
jgi:predicted lipoprotein with Yx(FWY)xxD motif